MLFSQRRDGGRTIYVSSSSPIPPCLSHSESSNNLSDTATTTKSTTTKIWTQEQLLEYSADQHGIVLSLSTLGPAYRAVARTKRHHDDDESTQILGYVEGFLRPGGTIVHLDKMEVFPARRTSQDDYYDGSGDDIINKATPISAKRQGGTLFGIGLLLGYLCLLYGRSRGYSVAEFLAIDDDENQHKRLVQFYQRGASGFEIVKYVGDDLADIPDRLLWGGCGTLMRARDIDVVLERWTRMLERSPVVSKTEKQQKLS